MAKNSGIEWTHHTFNPWRGCTKVSPGCDNCYAENWAKRFDPGIWGRGATRAQAAQSSWDEVLRWDRRCGARGIRERIFPSMCDPFDVEVDAAMRDRFFALIRRTPNLDWLLLTKRPNAMRKMLPRDWGQGWPNVWLGVSTENQAMADLRVPILLATPAALRFVSYEPALGPVDFRCLHYDGVTNIDALAGRHGLTFGHDGPRLDWIIAGGESTAGARAPDPDWFRSVRDQCVAAGVPFFFKQWGTWAPGHEALLPPDLRLQDAAAEITIEQWRLAGSTWMERGAKAENGHILDGQVWQQVPGHV